MLTSKGIRLNQPGARISTNPPGEEVRPGIALCLSSGGYRATLFHLGVVCQFGNPEAAKLTRDALTKGRRGDARLERVGERIGDEEHVSQEVWITTARLVFGAPFYSLGPDLDFCLNNRGQVAFMADGGSELVKAFKLAT